MANPNTSNSEALYFLTTRNGNTFITCGWGHSDARNEDHTTESSPTEQAEGSDFSLVGSCAAKKATLTIHKVCSLRLDIRARVTHVQTTNRAIDKEVRCPCLQLEAVNPRISALERKGTLCSCCRLLEAWRIANPWSFRALLSGAAPDRSNFLASPISTNCFLPNLCALVMSFPF